MSLDRAGDLDRASGFDRFVDGDEGVEHVVAEFTCCQVLRVGPDCSRHVQNPESLPRESSRDRDDLPLRILADRGEPRGPGDLHLAGEPVRIRHDEGSLRTGDLDDAHPRQRRLEAEHALAHPLHPQTARWRRHGWDLNRELGA